MAHSWSHLAEHVPEAGGGYELSGPPTTPQLFAQQSSSAIQKWIRLDAINEDCCALYALESGKVTDEREMIKHDAESIIVKVVAAKCGRSIVDELCQSLVKGGKAARMLASQLFDRDTLASQVINIVESVEAGNGHLAEQLAPGDFSLRSY